MFKRLFPAVRERTDPKGWPDSWRASIMRVSTLIKTANILMIRFTQRILSAPALLALVLCLSGTPLRAAAAPTAVIHTSMGDITVELFADKAPVTVANFVDYARSGFYDGTIFHRVISHFMIQGGGFTPDMHKKETGDPIANEAANGLSNERGTIAMARTNQPHSATAQFFINVQDNPNLDHTGENSSRAWGYAVFGRVTGGMDVVDNIRLVETTTRPPYSDVPVEPVVIEHVDILEP
jgi:cyclophilin family peptidyl-prolyl cis-trans isomerase